MQFENSIAEFFILFFYFIIPFTNDRLNKKHKGNINYDKENCFTYFQKNYINVDFLIRS